MKNIYLHKIIEDSVKLLELNVIPDIILEIPKVLEHGDLSTNIAFQLTKILRKPPVQIAKTIVDNLKYDKNLIDEVSIAGAGFINFRLSRLYYTLELEKIIETGNNYGRQNEGNGRKVNVEYVSANPTGLLHLGHGRNAVIGDTAANLYEWMGYDVTREYYFNNAGNQMNNLGKSVYARYMQLASRMDYAFPEDGYHGDYIKTIAQEVYEHYGDRLVDKKENNLKIFRKYAEEWCFDIIKKTLANLGIKQEVFFNEDSLYKDGKIQEVIDEFKKLDLAYEKDGALWLKLSQMGLEDDRVIVKSTGEPTYRLPDIAYHKEKFERGFDIIVDVFGSDHIATVPDVLAGVKALGYDSDKIKVLIHQFITLTENGEQVKMSKRTGKSYTLDELLAEVGSDVCRFFLLMRSISTHLEFDLALAKEQNEKNPVFYLQYAHARICSIFDKVKESGIEIEPNCDLTKLVKDEEISLIKQLINFPETIKLAAKRFEAQLITEYLREVASSFHIFYHNCRIIDAEPELRNARLALVNAARITLKNGLTILGINSPERM